MELKRCTEIDMRWKRKLGSQLCPEIDAILLPSSEKKAIDDSFNGPSVSAAIGWNRRPVFTKRSYLAGRKTATPVQLLHHLSEPSRSHKSLLACVPL